MSRAGPACGVGLVALVLVAVLASRPAATQTTSSFLIGKARPGGVGSQPGRRRLVAGAALRGRWVLLNFFASWCPPVPDRVAGARQVRLQPPAGQQVAVLGVVFGDTAGNAATFERQVGSHLAFRRRPRRADRDQLRGRRSAAVVSHRARRPRGGPDPRRRDRRRALTVSSNRRRRHVVTADSTCGSSVPAPRSPTRDQRGPGRAVLSLLSSRLGWLVVAVVAVVALGDRKRAPEPAELGGEDRPSRQPHQVPELCRPLYRAVGRAHRGRTPRRGGGLGPSRA